MTERASDEQSAADRIGSAIDRFERARLEGRDREAASAGQELLELAAEAGSVPVWTALVADGLLRRVEAAAPGPAALLDLLEQESYAPPETGIAAAVAARAEEIGHGNAQDSDLARTTERLLHALGDPAAAYRVERSRQSARRTHGTSPRPAAAPRLHGKTIVVAGGHPALRARIRGELLRAGVAAVREVPSAKEANRTQRDIEPAVAGADLTVVIVRQIAHSTSDQIRLAAERLGVPLAIADSAGTTGVLRAVDAFFTGR